MKNIQRFIGAFIGVFVFIFFYEWLVHGVLLKGFYEQTAHIWRPMSEMQSYMPQMMAFQLAIALWLTFVFTRLFREGGVKNGLLFGLYFGVFAAIMAASWYVPIPISKELAFNWFITSVVEGLGFGLILGLIFCSCKKDENAPRPL